MLNFSFTFPTDNNFSSRRFLPFVPAYFLHTFGETASNSILFSQQSS